MLYTPNQLKQNFVSAYNKLSTYYTNTKNSIPVL